MSEILQVANVRRGIIVVGTTAMHCLFHAIDRREESYSHFAVLLNEVLQGISLSGITQLVVPRIVSCPL